MEGEIKVDTQLSPKKSDRFTQGIDMSSFEMFSDKNIAAGELANLMVSTGWGTEGDYDATATEKSWSAYPMIVYCRDFGGLLVGYFVESLLFGRYINVRE